MLALYYYPSTASMVVHILLEELAVPYQRVLVRPYVQRVLANERLSPPWF